MDCLNKLRSNPCAWVEGETTVKNLITDIADKIVNAQILDPDTDQYENSKWKVLYHEREHDWVEYAPSIISVSGQYLHTDGKSYQVYILPDLTDNYLKDSSGCIWEIVSTAPADKGSSEEYADYRTGRYVNVEGFQYEEVYYEIPNSLAVIIDAHPDKSEKDFSNPWEKYQAYLVKHSRESYYDGEIEDKEWNYYKIVAPLPNDWTYFFWFKNEFLYGKQRHEYADGSGYYIENKTIEKSTYSSDHIKFTCKFYKIPEKMVLQCNTMDDRAYTLYIERPLESNNYFKLAYGFDIEFQSNLKGSPESSYIKACDLSTIGLNKTPKIINELEAYKAYERQLRKEDEPGGLILSEYISPYSYLFLSRNSTENWMPVKMRGADSLVRYWISFNNNRLLLVLEGDPSFEYESYYTSFVYIGKFNVLNPEDMENNFAFTVGMGDSDKSKTGFVYSDINKKSSVDYAKFGKYTSNGMDTVSVLKGRSNLSFQEYLPSFLIHLSNYPNVGTLPNGVKRLVLDNSLFQPSSYTEHYHSSPIYLVNGYEGYRGYLDGVVAIYDHNILDGDELDWEVGDYIETYKYFKITSPINFLCKSPSPGNTVSIAILKGIKRRG